MRDQKMPKWMEDIRPYAPFIMIGAAVLFDGAVLWGAYHIGGPDDRPWNLMSMVMGMGLSVPLGLLLSPLNEKEEERFSKIGKAVLTFMSGYLLSKLGAALDEATNPTVMLHPVPFFRLSAFVLCLAIGTPTMMFARTEWAPKP